MPLLLLCMAEAFRTGVTTNLDKLTQIRSEKEKEL
jgi:hypothetical protein